MLKLYHAREETSTLFPLPHGFKSLYCESYAGSLVPSERRGNTRVSRTSRFQIILPWMPNDRLVALPLYYHYTARVFVDYPALEWMPPCKTISD